MLREILPSLINSFPHMALYRYEFPVLPLISLRISWGDPISLGHYIDTIAEKNRPSR